MERLDEKFIGERFGKLIVQRWDTEKHKWECKCDCGKTTYTTKTKLKNGHTKSCGCLIYGHDPKRLKDITGRRFGRLVAIEHTGYTDRGQSIWRFQCDCGNIYEAQSAPVVYGSVISCGCYNREKTAKKNFKHGFSESGKKEKLYSVWCSMRKRCRNENDQMYKYYGGRGITSCEEWEDYPTFRKWAYENGYEEGLTIDRIDVNGNYSPDNCRWIPMAEQMQNTRRNKYLTFNGETKCIAEWSREIGVSHNTIQRRLSHGWTIEEALTIKPMKGANQTWRTKKAQ